MMNMKNSVIALLMLSSCMGPASLSDRYAVYKSGDGSGIHLVIDKKKNTITVTDNDYYLSFGKLTFDSKLNFIINSDSFYEPHLKISWPKDKNLKYWGEGDLKCYSNNTEDIKEIISFHCKINRKNYNFQYKRGYGLLNFTARCNFSQSDCVYTLVDGKGIEFEGY